MKESQTIRKLKNKETKPSKNVTEAQASRQQWENLVHAVGRLGYESGISFASMYN